MSLLEELLLQESDSDNDIVTLEDYCEALDKIKNSLKLSPKDLMTTQWVNMMIQRIQDAELIVDENGYSSLHANIKTALRTYLVSTKDNKKRLILKPIPGKEHCSKIIVPLEETYGLVKRAHVLTNYGSSLQINEMFKCNNVLISNICAEEYCKLYAEGLLRKPPSPPNVTLEQDVAEIESAVQEITSSTTTYQDFHHHQSSPQMSTAKHVPFTNHTKNCDPPHANDSPSNQDTQTTKIQDKHKKQDVETDESMKTLTTITDQYVIFETACSVDVLELTDCKDNLYEFLLIYQDKISNYIQLRPLTVNSEPNITVELIQIFMDFGLPKHLIIGIDNLKMYKGIVERIKTLTKTEIKLALDKNINPLIQRVANNIIEWMKVEECSNWGIGCNVVQWNMNNTVDTTGNSPYSHVFGYRYKGLAYKSKFRTSGYADDSDEDDLNIALDDDIIDVDEVEDQTVKRACNLDTGGRSDESDEESDKAVTVSNKSDQMMNRSDDGSDTSNEECDKTGEATNNESYIITVTEDVIKTEITDLYCGEPPSQHISEED